MKIRSTGDALFIVDAKKAFTMEGGLPAPEAEEIVVPIRRAAQRWLVHPQHIVDIADVHMPGHISFASSYEGTAPHMVLTPELLSSGTVRRAPHAQFTDRQLRTYLNERAEMGENGFMLWPDHAVFGTHEVMPIRGLEGIRITNPSFIKGHLPFRDSNSGFRDGAGYDTGLASLLHGMEIQRIFLTGLVFDVCVGLTAIDGANAGFETYVIEDGTRSLDMPPEEDGGLGSVEAMNRRFEEVGVRIITTDDLD